MKKLYTLATAALLALGANAQLYFVGAGEGLTWDLPGTEVQKGADGNYTITITSLNSFKMSTNQSTDWDGEGSFNAGALYAAGLSDKANLGKPCELEINGGPNNTVPWKGDYTLVISGDFTTITATTTTPEPVGVLPELYLRGDMNGWGAPDDWKFETTDGVLFWFDCTGATVIPEGTNFKIADADWSPYNYGYDDMVFPFEEPVQWVCGSNPANALMGADYEGTILFNAVDGLGQTADVTFFPTLVPHEAGVAVVADQNAPAEYFNLQGVRVANPENGLYIVRRGAKVSKVLVK